MPLTKEELFEQLKRIDRFWFITLPYLKMMTILREQMDNDENLVDLGVGHAGRKTVALIATDKRLIIISKAIFSAAQFEISNYQNINSVLYKKHLLSHWVHLELSSGLKYKLEFDIKKLAISISGTLQQYKSGGMNTQANSQQISQPTQTTKVPVSPQQNTTQAPSIVNANPPPSVNSIPPPPPPPPIIQQQQINEVVSEYAVEQSDSKSEIISCTKCHENIPANSKFCAYCGTKVGVIKGLCGSCGTQNAVKSSFCGNCGNKL